MCYPSNGERVVLTYDQVEDATQEDIYIRKDLEICHGCR